MNEGKFDRIVRAILGAVALIIAFVVVGGAAQVVLWVIGGILLLTAATGFCLLYYHFTFPQRNSGLNLGKAPITI